MMKLRRVWWVLAVLVMAGLVAGGLGLGGSIQREGIGKLAGVTYEKLRKEGFAATWQAIFARAGTSAAAANPDYSIYEAANHVARESAAERTALPEFKVIPAADPAALAPSRDAGIAHDTWHRSHGNERADKYSSLDQINRDNVGRLSVAWTYASGADLGDPSKIGTTVQTNPVIAGGRLFVGGDTHLISIDAANGREVWRTALPGPVARRGLVWEPHAEFAQSRLFVPTSKGVFALNAASGKVLAEFGDKGQVGGELSLIAPLIVGDKLIIAIVKPAVEAYDLKTGKFLWTRALIEKKPGEKTELYGGVPWAGMAADSTRKAVFVSTGNPRPELIGVARPGDNRNACSVVSINTETGAINWAFQEVAHDLWDLDIPGTPIVTSIVREGRRIDVVAAVTKFGNTLLLDRDNGRPIFDYRLRRAPVSSIPFERTAPYQPALELPQPFAKQVFEAADVTDLSAAARASVLHKTRGARHGFFEPPVIGGHVVAFGMHGGAEWPGAAVDPTNGVLIVPSNHLPWVIRANYLETKSTLESVAKVPGNALYQERCAACHKPTGEGSYEKETQGELYFPSLNGITALRTRENLLSGAEFEANHRGRKVERPPSAAEFASLYEYFLALDKEGDRQRSFVKQAFWQVLLDDRGNPGSKPPWGYLTALDLNSGRQIWRVPFGEYENLTRDGQPVKGQRNHGGAIVTAGGLVFATGTLDNKVRAFDSANGRELWAYKLPAAGSTPPSTYTIDGVQYVVVVASGGQFVGFSGRSDKIVAFRLPATEKR